MATRRIRIPDIAWIDIPGGEFLYGESRETRPVEPFRIARPITNAQYQCFIDDGGYDEPRWWEDLERQERKHSRWEQPNRPRTDVNWYEAMAFCRWLSHRPNLNDQVVRLPTEVEWERAARGTDGRSFPWGDAYQSGYANVDEKFSTDGPWYLEQTTAVGLYPHGGSADGVEDLAGTVWEWCLNKYDPPDATAVDTSGASRVLRGGAWFFDPDLARTDGRRGPLPGDRHVNRGFRVCVASPIS